MQPNMQKTKCKTSGGFRPDTLDYHDDVTTEAVEELRQAAKKQVDAEDWELIEGIDKESYAQLA